MMEQPQEPADFDYFARDAAREAERLVREAMTATLATIDRETGHPFATLVAVATAPDGTPLLLLSDLARHTANLKTDARASLLFTQQKPDVDPLALPRLTAVGSIARIAGPAAVARYVARHPEARDYVNFGDFACYALKVSSAHLVAGFGRIMPVQPDRIVGTVSRPDALAGAEPIIVQHMNDDHADALAAMAAAAGERPSRPVRLTGVDPGGIDLLVDRHGLRLFFSEPAFDPEAVRSSLVVLSNAARTRRV